MNKNIFKIRQKLLQSVAKMMQDLYCVLYLYIICMVCYWRYFGFLCTFLSLYFSVSLPIFQFYSVLIRFYWRQIISIFVYIDLIFLYPTCFFFVICLDINNKADISSPQLSIWSFFPEKNNTLVLNFLVMHFYSFLTTIHYYRPFCASSSFLVIIR